MLKKTPLVTVVAAVAGRAYQAASTTCVPAPPKGAGGGGIPPSPTPPPPPPPTPGSYVPAAGEGVLLVGANGNIRPGIAPVPVGYTCVLQDPFNAQPYPDGKGGVYIYSVVCTGP